MPVIKFPEVPDMPAMPAVTAPVLDGTFYAPDISGARGKTAAAQSTGKSTGSTTSETGSGTTVADTASAAAATANNGGTITASDLVNLNSLGVLGNLSGLIGNSRLSTGTLPGQVLPGTAQTDTTVLLDKILAELQNLKQSQAANIAAAGTAYTLKTSAAKPAILRFTVNGADILPSCRTVYFSGCEPNGSFLLTGDRKYSLAGKSRTETFYLLFSATGSDGSRTFYTVTPAVSQDSVNEDSCMYQLTKKNRLGASKTGNLVTMQVADSSWNMDLLLDIGTAGSGADRQYR
jgi:hypothetical protein